VGAFLHAAKVYFRAVFGTVAALKKARWEGGAGAFDALANKLFGEQWKAPGQWEQRGTATNREAHAVLTSDSVGAPGAGAFSLNIPERRRHAIKEAPELSLPSAERARWTE